MFVTSGKKVEPKTVSKSKKKKEKVRKKSFKTCFF
jgi:hypothetical protein